jgi:hypothetical protein
MLFSRITGALVVLHTAAAHTVFTTLYVDDINQGDGTCVRMGMTNPTAPVNDLTSTDMACGREGTKGVARVCPVKQGAKLSFEFRVWPDAEQSGSIDPQHKGSCSVYMKNVASAINDTAAGDGWFKIWAEGYDEASHNWCTDKLIANNGIVSVKIPDNLAGGNYLVRSEILALQEADKGNPQFYPGCAQIFLESTATTLPTDTVAIPGAVKITDPAATFNIYEPEKFPFLYPIPGPEPYIPGTSPSQEVPSVVKQSEGLPISNTILTVANWMGVEVAPWTDSHGCDKSIEGCWAQTKTCYDTAPPTGGTLCKILEDKCTDLRLACPSNKIPNEGTDLTPKPANRFAIPPAANAQLVGAPPSSPFPSASPSSATPSSTPISSSVMVTSTAPSTTQAGPLQPAPTQAPVYDASALPANDACGQDNDEEEVSTISRRQHPRELSIVFEMHTSYRVTGTAAGLSSSTPTDAPILTSAKSITSVLTSTSASLGSSVPSTFATLPRPRLGTSKFSFVAQTSTMTSTLSHSLTTHTPIATLTLISSRSLISQNPVPTSSTTNTLTKNPQDNDSDPETNDSDIPTATATRPSTPTTTPTTSTPESASAPSSTQQIP